MDHRRRIPPSPKFPPPKSLPPFPQSAPCAAPSSTLIETIKENLKKKKPETNKKCDPRICSLVVMRFVRRGVRACSCSLLKTSVRTFSQRGVPMARATVGCGRVACLFIGHATCAVVAVPRHPLNFTFLGLFFIYMYCSTHLSPPIFELTNRSHTQPAEPIQLQHVLADPPLTLSAPCSHHDGELYMVVTTFNQRKPKNQLGFLRKTKLVQNT